MSDALFEGAHLSDVADHDVIQYRAVSKLAVTALLVGIASPLAFCHPGLWLVPAAGLVIGVLALVRIAREEPAVIGRKAALVGLAISLVTAASAPSQWFTYRWMIDREARQFAAIWFQYLATDEPHKAYELTKYAGERRPLDDKLWEGYYEGSDLRMEMEEWVNRPGIRALLALGQRAVVRYYDTEGHGRDRGGNFVRQVYAVTYNDGDQTKTFFMALRLQRYRMAEAGRAAWDVADAAGGVQPKALKGPGNA